jgi:glycine cleavage system regulatory protein
MSGERLFHATLALTLPSGISTDVLRDALEALANEIMVDVELDPEA